MINIYRKFDVDMRLFIIVFNKLLPALLFLGMFIIIGLSFPLNEPWAYWYKYPQLKLIFNRETYLFCLALTTLILAPWASIASLRNNTLVWWLIFFSGVIAYHVLNGREVIYYSLFNLAMFISSESATKYVGH